MEQMTSKKRILSAVTGKETDRVPWSPFLAYYWQYVPREEQEKGEVAYMQKIGADPLLRGSCLLSVSEMKNVEHTSKRDGNRMFDSYITKVGTITEIRTYSAQADTWFLTGHPVSEEEDFKVLQYIYENMKITENIEPFAREYEKLGENAVSCPNIGVNYKTAFQALVERWCGTEALSYALYDFPETVEECLAVMMEKDRETVINALNSPAEILNFFEDSSTTNISPAMFEKYTLPQINEWADILHTKGKLLMHHACGHLKDIMPLIATSKIDILESVTPPPTGNIEIADAFAILPEHIALIGGIDPTFFESCTSDELEKYVKDLLSTARGRRFVLANSDSCPPGVTYDKFLLISDIVRNFR
jgi:uroporphyrinogen-III decarboxylase